MLRAVTAPLSGRAAWDGRRLDETAWMRRFEPRHLDEITAALAGVARMPLVEIGREEFRLDATQELLAGIGRELEDGLGLVRLRGIPPGRFSLDEERRLFWGLCAHLGTALYQNARGEIIGEVRDEARDAVPSYSVPREGHVASSRSRTRSTGALRFHTDRCDVIALYCARNAKAGGVSKLASSVTVYNEIARRRPDLLEVLCRDFWRVRPEDEDGGAGGRLYTMPVFAVCEGKLTSQYSRTYVEQAQEVAGVPPLTREQIEAMDLLAEVAEEVCLHAPFVPGDLQFLNNHVIYHGRTAYEDDHGAAQDRLLLRLWLSVPNSRRLPEGFDSLWGATLPGALRGGAELPDGSRSPCVAAIAAQ